MKYRRHDWFDTEKGVPIYGIQCKKGKNEKWLNLAEDRIPLLFDEEIERETKLKELRKTSRHAM